MILQYIKQILLLLAFSSFSMAAQAQLSIKTGYHFNYAKFDEVNGILQKFNENNNLTARPFGDLHIMHGFLLGLRYQLDYVALEFGWRNAFKNSSATVPNGSENEDQELFFRNNAFSFGVENTFNFFGYGATIDFSQTSIKLRETTESSKIGVLSEWNWSTQVYLAFTTKKISYMRLSLRPFVQIPLSKLNVSKLDQKLNGANASGNPSEGSLIFGFKLLFING